MRQLRPFICGGPLTAAWIREGAAQGFIRKHAFIRYAVIVAVFAVVMLTGAANPLAAFLGIMGLKAAAYMQPFIHKRRHPDTDGAG